MQVRELDPSTTSIKWFVVLSILVLLLSYSVRLLIRSRLWVQVVHLVMRSARAYSGLREKEPVPTGNFLHWMGYIVFVKPYEHLLATEFGDLLRDEGPLVLFIVVCGLIPLLSVWTNKGLHGGIKLVISLAICLTIVVTIVGMTAPSLRKALVKWAKRHRDRHTNRRMRRRIEEDRRGGNG